jgi:hypothetical protein
MGRLGGVAIRVTEPDRIAIAEHDVIGSGTALNRLMEVIAHRTGVGVMSEIAASPVWTL